MTTPRDPQQPHDPLEHDLGADYEAFLTEATRALEPSAADASLCGRDSSRRAGRLGAQ